MQSVCDEVGRAASHHHHRERARHRRLSQRAGVQRAGRVGHGRERCARRSPGRRRAAAHRPAGDLSLADRQEPAGSYHDAQQALDSGAEPVQPRLSSLEQRCIAENLYWAICRKIQKLARELDYFPEELEGLDAMLSDTYFCNFSLFQSMPDSWAIKQLVPHHADSPAGGEPTRPPCWATSPAIPTARWTSSSTAAT
jgi:hypothetical protein